MRNRAKSYNKLKLSIIALTALIAAIGYLGGADQSYKVSASRSGPTASHSGAPSESSCTSCHSDFEVNSGTGSLVITGLPAKYTPGSSYPVTITVNQFNAAIYGFQAVSLNRLNLQSGDYNLNQSPQLQTANGIVGGQQRRYVQHTLAGTTSTQFNTKSWTFNWIAPASSVGAVSLFAAGNGANGDGGTSGDYIYTNSVCTTSNVAQTRATFDGDHKADVSIFRPSNGGWYRLNSSSGQINIAQFGTNGDKIIPADFDGDGKNDLAVFRPSNGTWYIQRSSDNGVIINTFGISTDIPLVGDMTGDGRAELVVFRPSAGAFYRLDLTNTSFAVISFGTNGDKPVSGDFDGDGKSDYAVYRPSNGGWYVLQSSNGAVTSTAFGTSEDKPVPGDYDGDGKTDIAVFRPSNGAWYQLLSGGGFRGIGFGISTDQPAPTDYDGDCITDVAVFRNGNWYILNSKDNSVSSVGFGTTGDIAVPSAYTAQ